MLEWIKKLFLMLAALFSMLINTEEAYHLQMNDLNSSLQSRTDTMTSTYEVFVGSFCDSNNDGIGDLQGVISKLDYIQAMGFHAIWLMPIQSSPSYHKYDILDYCSIDPQYGTMADYDALVDACHARGMKAIIDTVLNHTASEHEWFRQATEYLRSLGKGEDPDLNECRYVDYYHFTRDAEDGYCSVLDTEWYYEGRFSYTMPDLNLDSELLREEIRDIMSFWIDHGTDGFRLDAVTSYYTGEDQKNIEFMRWLNDTGKSMKNDLYFVAEAWTSLDTYASYYQSGIDSFFDFAFASDSGVIHNTITGEAGADTYIYTCREAEQKCSMNNPDYINAPFYTNHDVNRSASYYEWDEDGSAVKLAQGLNLMMRGNVYLYYGEELGMRGSGRDQNKRGPMYWSKDSIPENCASPSGMDYIEMKYPALDEQINDPSSILSYVTQALKIRNAYPVIARGNTVIVEELTDHDVCLFFRENGYDETVLIAINTSAYEKRVDFSDNEGWNYISAALNTNEGSAWIEGEELILPARTIAVITHP